MIDCTNNSLQGDLIADICAHLPFLEGFYLSYNELSGNIPFGLSKYRGLQILSLSINKIIVGIPSELGN